MHHFFVKPEQVMGEEIKIAGADFKHLKNVLRMKPGEELTVSAGTGVKYRCILHDFSGQTAIASIQAQLQEDTELKSRIHLFQGLPKGDKFEWMIQKAVELGVHEIIPVETARCVAKIDSQKVGRKVERWNAIAESAAKQSGRSFLPAVTSPIPFSDALKSAEKLDVLLIPYELSSDMKATKEILSSIDSGMSVGIFIGPEGGFERSEIEMAIGCKAQPITLGKRILRTETAGLVILSILMYQLES